MSRLSLSSSDKLARDWFVGTTRSLGCKTHVDAMGNTFAIRPGLKEEPPTYAGSHLDTQPMGGRYDGILGVMAGVEAMRVLNENWVETEFPTGVINWTNEEGARFPISMVSSGVWAGSIPLERAHNLREVGGGTATMKSELERIGYLGQTPASHTATPIGAHFELHIEQGPHLTSHATNLIGAVTGVQAYRWHTLTVTGRPSHTGTTAFPHRADALLLTAKLILHSHVLATRHSCLASTGVVDVRPGSTNTVPGTVRFSLDIRAEDDARLMAFEDELKRDFERLVAGEEVGGLGQGGVKGMECEVEWRLDAASEAVKFDERCVKCVEDSAGALFPEAEREGRVRRMISGAGHDSVYTSKRSPTAMIFVPCRDGKRKPPPLSGPPAKARRSGNHRDTSSYDERLSEDRIEDVQSAREQAEPYRLGTFKLFVKDLTSAWRISRRVNRKIEMDHCQALRRIFMEQGLKRTAPENLLLVACKKAELVKMGASATSSQDETPVWQELRGWEQVNGRKAELMAGQHRVQALQLYVEDV
ncbi:MAG: hypothetical protein M1833_004164 [Piccolia ochrophora]|nr:MAG: hypothetical protein M1833_004164 [Piccolia ochrophora]